MLEDETELSELPLDSLDLLESLFELESHYDRTLSNAELACLKTVGDLAQLFSRSLNQS